MLLLVALFPLLGMVASTWLSVRDARSVMSAANDADRLSHEAVLGTDIAGALFDEMAWRVVDVAPSTLGLPRGLLESALGMEAADGLERAEARLDVLLADAGWSDLTAAVAALRASDVDIEAALNGYQALIEDADAITNAALAHLAVTPRGSDQRRLAEVTESLQLALAARSSVIEEFFGYFATQWDVRGTPSVEFGRMYEAHSEYHRSLTALRERGEFADVLAGLEDVQSVRALDGAVETLIARLLADGIPEVGAPLTLENALPQVPTLAPMFTAGLDASSASNALVEQGAAQVIDAVDAVTSDGRRKILQASLLAVFLTGATAVMALLAVRLIVRPLRQLRQSADALRVGQEPEPSAGDGGGPVEIRAASHALADAGDHFQLVTLQAKALAAGDLDAEVLDRSAPGGLGQALQSAVGRLRRALSQQEEFRRRLAHEAAHDGLTKLANRNASLAQLTRSLARTARSGTHLAVLFIDLDHFKDVNDRNGHHAGDAVLTAVAQRLVTNVREGDHVGRLGGDEFLVVAEPIEGVDEAVLLAARIIAALDEPIDVGDQSFTVGASVGIAITDERALSADELLRDADLAVYRAKHVGRGGIEVCNEELRLELARSADLASAIRSAIDDDELVLHYQPIVDAASGVVQALEALVRWQRTGEPNLVPPDEFITFSERSDLIVEIDRWVIEHVAAQIAEWGSDDRFEGVPVAVNISGRHLGHEDFVDHVLAPLARHGVSPGSIIVEVTESALLDDLTAAAVKLQQLRDAGVRVSIDDFGTGYTSLAHLRTLPVDNLKIDRSFTARALDDANEASIIKLIVDTGHLLGVTITAEGVENEQEVDKLTALGSDSLQGFYFARPAPPDSVGLRPQADGLQT